jgi:hypothetical protein
MLHCQIARKTRLLGLGKAANIMIFLEKLIFTEVLTALNLYWRKLCRLALLA